MGKCEISGSGIILHMKKENIKKLLDIGINMFNLANNHSDDCGETNYASIQDALRSEHIPAFGDAKNGTEYIWSGIIRGEPFAFIGVNSIETSVDWRKKISKIQSLTNS